METKSLNLNIEFYENEAFIKVFMVKGTNPKTQEREHLGLFTNEERARKSASFWKETMGYIDTTCLMELAWI